MIGDENTQPNEGVTSLSDLAEMMDAGEEEVALGELDSEESDESEGGEVESEVDADDEAEDEGEPEKLKFTIKHDGKDVDLELTPEEHAAMLQQSFDYSKKTMAVAEERKAAEAQRAQAEQYRQHNEQALTDTLTRLNAYKTFMEQEVGDPPPIEWAKTDAHYYLAQKELYEGRKGQLAQVDKQIQTVQEEAHRQRQAWLDQEADSTLKHLQSTLPGWNDELHRSLAEYVGKNGLTVDSIGPAFVNKGLWELAHKAKAYDDLQAEKAKLKPKSELPRVQKPSATNQPPRARQAEEALKRHKAAPSLRTLADLDF